MEPVQAELTDSYPDANLNGSADPLANGLQTHDQETDHQYGGDLQVSVNSGHPESTNESGNLDELCRDSRHKSSSTDSCKGGNNYDDDNNDNNESVNVTSVEESGLSLNGKQVDFPVMLSDDLNLTGSSLPPLNNDFLVDESGHSFCSSNVSENLSINESTRSNQSVRMKYNELEMTDDYDTNNCLPVSNQLVDQIDQIEDHASHRNDNIPEKNVNENIDDQADKATSQASVYDMEPRVELHEDEKDFTTISAGQCNRSMDGKSVSVNNEETDHACCLSLGSGVLLDVQEDNIGAYTKIKDETEQANEETIKELDSTHLKIADENTLDDLGEINSKTTESVILVNKDDRLEEIMKLESGMSQPTKINMFDSANEVKMSDDLASVNILADAAHSETDTDLVLSCDVITNDTYNFDDNVNGSLTVVDQDVDHCKAETEIFESSVTDSVGQKIETESDQIDQLLSDQGQKDRNKEISESNSGELTPDMESSVMCSISQSEQIKFRNHDFVDICEADARKVDNEKTSIIQSPVHAAHSSDFDQDISIDNKSFDVEENEIENQEVASSSMPKNFFEKKIDDQSVISLDSSLRIFASACDEDFEENAKKESTSVEAEKIPEEASIDYMTCELHQRISDQSMEEDKLSELDTNVKFSHIHAVSHQFQGLPEHSAEDKDVPSEEEIGTEDSRGDYVPHEDYQGLSENIQVSDISFKREAHAEIMPVDYVTRDECLGLYDEIKKDEHVPDFVEASIEHSPIDSVMNDQHQGLHQINEENNIILGGVTKTEVSSNISDEMMNDDHQGIYEQNNEDNSVPTHGEVKLEISPINSGSDILHQGISYCIVKEDDISSKVDQDSLIKSHFASDVNSIKDPAMDVPNISSEDQSSKSIDVDSTVINDKCDILQEVSEPITEENDISVSKEINAEVLAIGSVSQEVHQEHVEQNMREIDESTEMVTKTELNLAANINFDGEENLINHAPAMISANEESGTNDLNDTSGIFSGGGCEVYRGLNRDKVEEMDVFPESETGMDEVLNDSVPQEVHIVKANNASSEVQKSIKQNTSTNETIESSESSIIGASTIAVTNLVNEAGISNAKEGNQTSPDFTIEDYEVQQEFQKPNVKKNNLFFEMGSESCDECVQLNVHQVDSLKPNESEIPVGAEMESDAVISDAVQNTAQHESFGEISCRESIEKGSPIEAKLTSFPDKYECSAGDMHSRCEIDHEMSSEQRNVLMIKECIITDYHPKKQDLGFHSSSTSSTVHQINDMSEHTVQCSNETIEEELSQNFNHTFNGVSKVVTNEHKVVSVEDCVPCEEMQTQGMHAPDVSRTLADLNYGGEHIRGNVSDMIDLQSGDGGDTENVCVLDETKEIDKSLNIVYHDGHDETEKLGKGAYKSNETIETDKEKMSEIELCGTPNGTSTDVLMATESIAGEIQGYEIQSNSVSDDYLSNNCLLQASFHEDMQGMTYHNADIIGTSDNIDVPASLDRNSDNFTESSSHVQPENFNKTLTHNIGYSELIHNANEENFVEVNCNDNESHSGNGDIAKSEQSEISSSEMIEDKGSFKDTSTGGSWKKLSAEVCEDDNENTVTPETNTETVENIVSNIGLAHQAEFSGAWKKVLPVDICSNIGECLSKESDNLAKTFPDFDTERQLDLVDVPGTTVSTVGIEDNLKLDRNSDMQTKTDQKESVNFSKDMSKPTLGTNVTTTDEKKCEKLSSKFTTKHIDGRRPSLSKRSPSKSTAIGNSKSKIESKTTVKGVSTKSSLMGSTVKHFGAKPKLSMNKPTISKLPDSSLASDTTSSRIKHNHPSKSMTKSFGNTLTIEDKRTLVNGRPRSELKKDRDLSSNVMSTTKKIPSTPHSTSKKCQPSPRLKSSDRATTAVTKVSPKKFVDTNKSAGTSEPLESAPRHGTAFGSSASASRISSNVRSTRLRNTGLATKVTSVSQSKTASLLPQAVETTSDKQHCVSTVALARAAYKRSVLKNAAEKKLNKKESVPPTRGTTLLKSVERPPKASKKNVGEEQ